jgi:protein-tyrosine phosphatase
MIDTHLHILPAIDDGPETIQETIMLARALVEEGVHSAIATPHYNDEFPHHSASEIRERVRAVQQELDRQEVSLRLFAGHEVLIKPGLVEDIQKGRVATLNGSRYLLLELWNNGWMPETERVIFQLRLNDIVPIIAHPERYRPIQKDPQRLAALLRQGALAQIMVGSLLGTQGGTTQRTAEILLKKGMAHCLASDAHDLRKRPPRIRQSLQRAEQLISRSLLYRMIETVPAAIVQNAAYSV